MGGFFVRKTVECRLAIYPDESGGFCARCTNLAGVYGEGETVELAADDAIECFKGVAESYLGDSIEVPFRPDIHIEHPDAVRKWIKVTISSEPS